VQQDDPQLPSVAGVDEAGCVDDRDPVAHREARPRLDKARVTLGDGNSEPGRDRGPLPRAELDALAGREIEPRVVLVRALGDDRVLAEPHDRQLDHEVARSAFFASATRNGAKRRSSRRGRRALTSTPSSESSRSSIGAPSAYSSDSVAAWACGTNRRTCS